MSISVHSIYNAYSTSGASAPSSPAQKMSNLFDQIDTGNSGSINKAQFEKAFQKMNPPASFKAAGAEAIWSELDPSGTGLVSKDDFVDGMVAAMKKLRGSHQHSSSQPASQIDQGKTLLDELDGTTPSDTTQQGNQDTSLLSALEGNSDATQQATYGGIGSIFTAYA